MRRSIVLIVCIVALAQVLLQIAQPPHYPDDWPPLGPAAVSLPAGDCPDLTGS